MLELAAANARENLGGEARAAFRTAALRWGGISPLPAVANNVDVVLGADITYSRDSWPALAQTVRQLRAPMLPAVPPLLQRVLPYQKWVRSMLRRRGRSRARR